MNAVTQTLELDAGEARLLTELLEREQKALVSEIHHSRTAEYRVRLRTRLDQVEQLLDQISVVPGAATH